MVAHALPVGATRSDSGSAKCLGVILELASPAVVPYGALITVKSGEFEILNGGVSAQAKRVYGFGVFD